MNKELQMTQPANVNTSAMLGVNANTNEQQDPHLGMVPEFYEDEVFPLVRKHLDPLLAKFKIPRPNSQGKIKGPSKVQVKFFQMALQKTGLTLNVAGKYVKQTETFFIFCAQASKMSIALNEMREMHWKSYNTTQKSAGDVN